MMKSDPYLARIEAFNLKNGGGVTIKKVQNGYNLYLTATDAPKFSSWSLISASIGHCFDAISARLRPIVQLKPITKWVSHF